MTPQIVVFGANGCLGTALRSKLGDLAVYFGREIDITHRTAVFSVVSPIIRLVINCAAYTDVHGAEQDHVRAFQVNAMGAQNVAMAARRRDAMLVHVSTDAVFDGSEGANDELSDPRPRGVYGRSKLLGERMVRDADCQHVIVRTCNLYGRGGKGFRSQIVPKLRAEQNIRVESYRRVVPTWAGYVVDVIGALVARHTAPGSNLRGLYHVACAGETTWWKFAERAALAVGSSSQIDMYADPNCVQDYGTSYVDQGVPHGLLTSVTLPMLGIEPKSWEDALNDYIDSEAT